MKLLGTTGVPRFQVGAELCSVHTAMPLIAGLLLDCRGSLG